MKTLIMRICVGSVLITYCLVANAASHGDFSYEEEEASITITGYTGLGGAVIIPDIIAGKPVTQIGFQAFFRQTGVTRVIIPNSVISIGNLAFAGCAGLPSVTIPDSVITIGEDAFPFCTGLTNVTIGNSVESIGDYAFYDCASLTSVSFPESVAGIGVLAFANCTGLTNVTIGSSVSRIANYAFYGCTGLTAFSVDSGNQAYSSMDGILFDKNQQTLLQYPGNKPGNYGIPESVTTISDAAFFGCTTLTNVTIPSGVTNIGSEAFSGCTGLARVTIPNSVENIADFIFSDCSSLTAITLGNSVTNLGWEAFAGCTALRSLAIPRTVATIRNYAFSGCTQLTSLYFSGPPPDSGSNAFAQANKATVYYRASTEGWGSPFSGRPAALWIPEEDLDSDLMTNLEEMLAGTDPSDSISRLVFEQTARADELASEDKLPLGTNEFVFYFQSIPGRSYEIYSAEALGSEWTKINILNASTTQKRVVLSRPSHLEFYRILVVPAQ